MHRASDVQACLVLLGCHPLEYLVVEVCISSGFFIHGGFKDYVLRVVPTRSAGPRSEGDSSSGVHGPSSWGRRCCRPGP